MRPSLLEAHLARWGPVAPRSLSRAAARSMTMEELLALADPESARLRASLSLGYASTPGLPVLREAIAGLHDGIGADSVLTTAGAQEALFCAFRALLEPDDHVVSFVPCYEDLATLPAALGAEVTTVPLRPERGFRPDVSEVEAALRPDTRLIVLNTPHNPTGARIDPADAAAILDLAAARGAFVLGDEVFRLLARDPARPVADLYERGISLDAFFAANAARIRWTRPAAGCLGWPEVTGGAVEDLAERMATEEGVLRFPARLFLGEGERFRLGYGGADLPELLPALARQLAG